MAEQALAILKADPDSPQSSTERVLQIMHTHAPETVWTGHTKFILVAGCCSLSRAFPTRVADAINRTSLIRKYVLRMPTSRLFNYRGSYAIQNNQPITPTPGSPTRSRCRDNELGYLFYQHLGGSFDPWADNNGPFFDLTYTLWSSTIFAFDFAPDHSWAFVLTTGNQDFYWQPGSVGAFAVRDGDVVPVPAAVWLLGSGLLGLVGIVWRSNRQQSIGQ